MDGQQLAWVIIICTMLLCFTVAGIFNSFNSRLDVHIEPPFADAPPEVWLAYYQTVAVFNDEKVKTNV